MSKRFLTPAEKRKSSERARKEKLCRWCGQDVKRLNKHRRTFCSDECVHEFSIRSSSSYIRQYIAKRDNYICQICGLDCKGFLRQLKREVNDRMVGLPHSEWRLRRKEFETAYFAEHGMEWVNTDNRSTFYDIDHIVPVVKGGGQCGEENLRTVCLGCHRKETARLRKELKKSKEA